MRNPYSQLGLGLVVAGVAFIPTSYFLLRSTPLTALGISLAILGAVCLTLGRTRPKIPPEVSSLLMETGLENLASLLEELGLKSQGIFLPSSLTSGQPQALIPLHPNPRLPQLEQAVPKRLIVQYGANPEDIGLLVTTIGSNIIHMLESKPGSSSDEIAAALTSILVGTLDVADGVKIHLGNKKVLATISHPRLEYKNTWLEQTLGSPLASVVASLVAEALDRPVIVAGEEFKRGENLIELEIL